MSQCRHQRHHLAVGSEPHPEPAVRARCGYGGFGVYQIEAWSAVRNYWRATRLRAEPATSVSPNVIALGVTSLLTDIASEMVGTVLPIFLVLHLGLTPLHFGVVEGLYQGLTAVLRVASGVAVDRLRQPKLIALIGYGMSAVSRLAMVFAGAGQWALVVGSVAADRLGKGIRVVPRDLLISTSTSPSQLATAFGVHRAFDSAGAMLGPLCALAILAAAPGGFDIVFMVSFSLSLCGVAALWLFVSPDQRSGADAVPVTRVAMGAAWRSCMATPGLLRLMLAASALSLATVSDGFIYLLLQRHAGFNPGLLPLLYVGTSFSYLLLAVPAGRLADRIGQQRGLLVGYLALLACYVVAGAFVLALIGPAMGVVLAIVCLGTYYALTDGVLMAATSRLLPAPIRGNGLAWVTTFTSLARSIAAVAFGALWTSLGEGVALASAATALVAALTLSLWLLNSRAPASPDMS